MMMIRQSGLHQLRYAERQSRASQFQAPPRMPRLDPAAGPKGLLLPALFA